ncbi:uncharacterized protein LACBIDRAFT_321923 [Laccaria bicolor S238N-H82]|uniref:Predicted protein n=1 Tax=Laccaria bicolor (strain S238N-H82 / ATCC MYA-4686) TaxID=486041 RepID=B0CUM9_LACBS|nr:uncharacterized protein LACBIDRAFT_321923 [Laccaria bicolor S238N-H82]EDR14118.1 predicted protein [Laccaria bicolor S238N-H82]|eukprot:XP_001874677.1 predicted protein [Laccaria bicolor S238N-H82]
MVSTRRKKAAISAEFIEDSDESDGNETYQEEDHLPTELYSSSSDECGGEDDDEEEEEEEKAEMSEPEIVEVPTTPRKRGRPRKAPAAMPTPAKFVICTCARGPLQAWQIRVLFIFRKLQCSTTTFTFLIIQETSHVTTS